MPRINLLPWREAERKRKRQEFVVGALGALRRRAALVALLGQLADERGDRATRKSATSI